MVSGEVVGEEHRPRFAAIVASIDSPQFTQRQAGAEDAWVLSTNKKSVKLGPMKP